MNSRKNKYFIKLITSYSLLLVIVLILGIVFHFILSHNAKQELLNENMLSLKNVSEQYSNCYANIYLISKRIPAFPAWRKPIRGNERFIIMPILPNRLW